MKKLFFLLACFSLVSGLRVSAQIQGIPGSGIHHAPNPDGRDYLEFICLGEAPSASVPLSRSSGGLEIISPGDSVDICLGDSFLFTVNYADTFNFQWYLDTFAIGGATEDSLWASAPGVYTVTARSPSGNVSDSTTSGVTLLNSIPPTPANAGPDMQFCNEAIITLQGNGPQVGSGQWSMVTGGGLIQYPEDSFSQVVGIGIGDNQFVWTISNGTCPPSMDTVSILNYPRPVANFSFVISGNSVQFTDLSGGNPQVWDWDFGDGGGSAVQNPSHVYPSGGNYTACLTVTDTNFCTGMDCRPVAIPVSVQEGIESAPLMRVFPNPTSGPLTLFLTSVPVIPLELELFDSQGRKRITFFAEKEESLLDLSGLPSGIYFLRVGERVVRVTVMPR